MSQLSSPGDDRPPSAFVDLLLEYSRPVAAGFDRDGDEVSEEELLRVRSQLLESEPVELSRDDAQALASRLCGYWDDYHCFQSIEGDYRRIALGVAGRLESHTDGSPYLATLTDCVVVTGLLWDLREDQSEDLDWITDAVRHFMEAAERLGAEVTEDGLVVEPDAPPPPDARAASPYCYLR